MCASMPEIMIACVGPRVQGAVAPVERDEKDDIPLRIVLSLLDEIFQLKGNQWMRRSVVVFLRGVRASVAWRGRGTGCFGTRHLFYICVFLVCLFVYS